MKFRFVIFLSICFVLIQPLRANEVEKVLFLVIENNEIVASNALSGRFERLKLGAKEKVLKYKVANAVAVVVTNHRYVAYGVITGGWQSIKFKAQEKNELIQVEDYSANVVTSKRILNFNGRRGNWTETRRSVK